jgi:transposase
MLGPPKTRDLDRPVLSSMEALVPQDHFYRHLDAQLDLSFVRDWVKDYYAEVGRPSVDPVVFFKLQLVLYLEGLRSERQLMRLAADRLSVRWYLGYGLDEPLPDHSTLTRIRERYGLEVFRRFFEAIVQRCVDAGLVWGKELYFDATKVQANASLDSLKPRFAVDEHLRNLFNDQTDEDSGDSGDAPATEEYTGAKAEPEQLLADVPEDLAEANSSRHDWVAEAGRPERDIQRYAYRRVADFRMSTTDPDATTMRTADGVLRLGYQDSYITDGGRARIILNVLVTPGEVMENQPALDLLWQTCFRWHLLPHQATGDTTYGTIEIIRALEDAGIRAYLPLPDFDERTPYFGPSKFTYEAEADVYHCPDGKTLRRNHVRYNEAKIQYRGKAGECNACPLKAQCTASDEGRTIQRSLYEAYLDRVRAYHQTEPYARAMRKRKVWVEPLFAEGKMWHGLRRFRLRWLERVNIEALMIASAQNLKRLLADKSWGRRPASGMAAAPLQRENSITTALRMLLGRITASQGQLLSRSMSSIAP